MNVYPCFFGSIHHDRFIPRSRYFIGNITASASTNGATTPPEFFLACGGMADKYCNDTMAAVAELNAAGHKNIHYVDLTPSSTDKDPTYMGCGESEPTVFVSLLVACSSLFVISFVPPTQLHF